MGQTTMTDAKIPHSEPQPLPGEHSCREVLQHALVELHQWEAYEHAKEEEWFEVDDPEMYAYHRGYERGVERSLSILENALKAAGNEEAVEKPGQQTDTST
ncbi:hypothetical protein [Nitrolancea hollandica]|uniref:Uncharacterized protein n=1 Tax=Nitrolancea hollandica Lb TaxID=1129897 RepID=I4EIU5_9BACT|nr:hypothetical protein [Nitrolancea hollandica]CCF84607.1 hypothetical protein NITHO_3630013 [Nitrolancea hollandica Lb]